jgi:hypothetical protein
MTGLKHAPETLVQMSKSQTGRKHSEETLAKMSEAQKNRKYKPYEIERMKTLNIGRKASPETRAKLSIIHSNPTAEQRYKFGSALRGKHPKPESIEKSALSRSGEFIIISPDGIETHVRGLARFCRQNGLDQGTMSRVAQGKAKSYKGWKCRKIEK